jgi:hypothetical protein
MMGAIHHLATHPEDQRELRENPSMIPQAVEEFVRVFPPVVALGRYVTQDVELGGHQFTKLRIALEELLAAMYEFRVADGAEPAYETGVLRTMTSLPLVFERPPVNVVA